MNKYFNQSANTAEGRPKFLPPQKRVQPEEETQNNSTQPQSQPVEKIRSNENQFEKKDNYQRDYQPNYQQNSHFHSKQQFKQNSYYNNQRPQYSGQNNYHNQHYTTHQSHSVDPKVGNQDNYSNSQNEKRLAGSFFGR